MWTSGVNNQFQPLADCIWKWSGKTFIFAFAKVLHQHPNVCIVRLLVHFQNSFQISLWQSGIFCCYRPQTKLREGYVFTPVCHSVHRDGWVYVSKGECVSRSVCVQGSAHLQDPEADAPQTHRQTLPAQRQTHPPPVRGGHWSGRCASYWNAFLFILCVLCQYFGWGYGFRKFETKE